LLGGNTSDQIADAVTFVEEKSFQMRAPDLP
jgi:hypothetical protein